MVLDVAVLPGEGRAAPFAPGCPHQRKWARVTLPPPTKGARSAPGRALSHRWGTRYSREGKVIWTEQSLEPPTAAPLLDFDLLAPEL